MEVFEYFPDDVHPKNKELIENLELTINIGSFRLRRWKSGDEDILVGIANNKNIQRNFLDTFPHPYTMQDATSRIEFNNETKDQLNFAIEQNGVVIGSIGLVLNKYNYGNTALMGFWLAEKYWGKGIMKKIIKGFLEFIFANMDLMRIECEVFEGNESSLELLKKLGFRCEGFREKRIYKDGNFLGEHMLGILKEDFEKIDD